MTDFLYEFAEPNGVIKKGKLSAASEGDALSLLQSRNIWATKLKAVPVSQARRFSLKDGALFFRGLSNLLEAGIPLDRALSMVSVSDRHAGTVERIKTGVREGMALGAALDAVDVFPPMIIGLVRAGESTGLARAVSNAADQLEQDDELNSEIVSAMAYPAVLVAVGLTAVLVLVVGVLPRFVMLFDGIELPPATAALVSLSSFVQHSWPWLLVGAGLSGVFLGRWLNSSQGHAALLQFPVLGRLRLSFATARASAALGALLETGAPMLSSIETSSRAAGDREIASRLLRAAEKVRVGHRLAESLKSEGALTSQAIQLIAAGEESGRLPTLLSHASTLARSEGRRTLQTLIKLIEPSLIVGFGGVVGFVALALLQAVYGIRSGLL